MKWIVRWILVLLVCVLGLGFARGWFTVSKTPDTESNKVNINVTVDPDKVKEDAEKVKDLPTELQTDADKSSKSEDEKTPDPQ